jgi:ABC-type ATPase involved in cell division
MKLDRNNIHIEWNEISQKYRNRWTNFAAVAMETKKGEFNFFSGFLSSNFMKLCRNIHRGVWQLLRG